MIALKFSLLPDSPDQQALVLRDETGDYHPTLNTGGYGGVNLLRTQVDYIILNLLYPDGSQKDFQLNYQPTGYSISLSALSYAPQVKSLSGVYAVGPANATYDLVSAFPDGYYKATYSIYSRYNAPARSCEYSATGIYKSGYKVWAMKNGGWFDVTSSVEANSIDNTVISFTHEVPKTTDTYYLFQVRNEDGDLVGSGEYEASNCEGLSGTVTLGSPVLHSAASVEFTLVGKTLQMMAPKAFKTLNTETTTPDEQKSREDVVLSLGQLLYLKEVPSPRRNFETFPVIHSLLC